LTNIISYIVIIIIIIYSVSFNKLDLVQKSSYEFILCAKVLTDNIEMRRT
jgi:hypothetical protein